MKWVDTWARPDQYLSFINDKYWRVSWDDAPYGRGA
jgi:hypothetical protein